MRMHGNFSIIDLTHPISAGMPHWPGDPATKIKKLFDIKDDGYTLHQITIGEHSGTHIGAPAHFVASGTDISHWPAEKLFLPALKIDMSKEAGENPDFLLRPKHILQWEQKHRVIPAGTILILQTNWSRFWSDRKAYMGLRQGEMRFPGFSVQAAELLISKKVCGLGIDTHGVDGGVSKEFAVNRALAENNLIHLENLANLEKLPDQGAYLFIGALPVVGGSGSPCRVLALIRND